MAVAYTTGLVNDAIIDRDGYPFLNEPVTVYVYGSTTPAAIFSDGDLSVPISALNTDDSGNLKFYAAVGQYDIIVRGERETIPVSGIKSVEGATTTRPGIIQLSGALSGTYMAPTIPGLDAKYEKPSAGIPFSHLTESVRSSLLSADSATQNGVTQQQLAQALSDLKSSLANAFGWINVKDSTYGAVGNGSTIDTNAVQQALGAAAPGQTVFFPLGEYLIDAALVLKRGQVIEGSYAPWWAYNTGFFCSLVPTTSFNGSALIKILDSTYAGVTADPHGVRIRNIGLNGKSRGSDLHGIEVQGYVTDFQTLDVNVRDFSGKGIYLHPRVVRDGSNNITNVYFQKGCNFTRTVVESCDGSANWHIEDVTDSAWENCHSHFPAGDAWYITGAGDDHFHGLRNTFGKAHGIHTAPSPNGRPWTGATFTNISTDRQEGYGLYLTHTGSRGTSISGVYIRRDGANANAGGNNLAGIAIIGTSGNKVAPINISGLSMSTGQDDSNAGTPSPQYAVAMSYGRSLTVNGQLWGVDDAVLDLGNNDELRFGNDLVIQTGAPSTTVNYRPRIKEISTEYTVKLYEQGLLVTTGGASRTMHLPRPYQGLFLNVKCMDSGTVNVDCAYANVEGASSISFSGTRAVRRLMGTGSAWELV